MNILHECLNTFFNERHHSEELDNLLGNKWNIFQSFICIVHHCLSCREFRLTYL